MTDFVKIKETLAKNRRLQLVLQHGREERNRRRAASPDGLEDVPLEEIRDEGNNIIQPSDDAGLPGQVAGEFEIFMSSPRQIRIKTEDEKVAVECSDDACSSDESAAAENRIFTISERSPSPANAVRIELRKVSLEGPDDAPLKETSEGGDTVYSETGPGTQTEIRSVKRRVMITHCGFMDFD